VALDFCLIDGNGVPLESIPIGIRRHRDLFAVARGTTGTPLLMRMADFHKDVVYAPSEVRNLAAELRLVIDLDHCSETVVETAMLLLSVCEVAESEGAAIEAIAD
jgi:hypothetical protein